MEGVSAEQIGIFVLIVMGLGKFTMDWLKHRREESDQLERRHTPSIDEKIANAETRCFKEIAKVEAARDAESQHLHKRISDLRRDLDTAIRESQEKQGQRLDKLLDQITRFTKETAQFLGKLDASVESLKQQQYAISQQLQRHIESQKNKQ